MPSYLPVALLGIVLFLQDLDTQRLAPLRLSSFRGLYPQIALRSASEYGSSCRVSFGHAALVLMLKHVKSVYEALKSDCFFEQFWELLGCWGREGPHRKVKNP